MSLLDSCLFFVRVFNPQIEKLKNINQPPMDADRVQPTWLNFTFYSLREKYNNCFVRGNGGPVVNIYPLLTHELDWGASLQKITGIQIVWILCWNH